jgi:CYTH domain-containing protein
VSVREIERKFLIEVSSLPDGLDSSPQEQIQQGYLAVSPNGTEVRLRRKGDRCFLTVKSPGGLQRLEREVELTPDQFESLWPATSGQRVEKVRYLIQLRDHQIELDRFAGTLEGLLVAEVEFPTVEASQAFSPPDWFGREVTQDERYKNRNLALHGLDVEAR